MFTLKKEDQTSKARLGEISTAHGNIQSPFFMPVGTNGIVKSMTFEMLNELNAQILLSNTYHLFLRPGMDVLKETNGLHGLSGWKKPMLTDSGGYQVFSLANLRKITDEGVDFNSHIDGASVYLTPEKVIEIEQIIGADMIMPLDVCAPYPCERDEALQSIERTTLWAKRSKEYFLKHKRDDWRQYLFGIIQGSTFKDLRVRSAEEITNIDFDGYAIGGVSVGENEEEMFEALNHVEPFMPKDKPRYFMGIGYPDQIVKAVGEGMDMFDCVLPSRFGRHATAFTSVGRVALKNAEHIHSNQAIDEHCDCFVCRKYTRNYIRHLVKCSEITGLTLITYHNLYFYVNLMKQIREAIEEDRFELFKNTFIERYQSQLLKG